MPEPPSNSVKVPKERRRSFMEYGGANSLSNFASSYSRAQHYTGSSLLESDDSDNNEGANQSQTERRPTYASLISNEGRGRPSISEETVIDEEIQIDGTSPAMQDYDLIQSREHEDIHRYRQQSPIKNQLPGPFESNELMNDTTPLLPTLSNLSSLASLNLKAGNSTAPQTIFNSVNTLVGIGNLSIPFGFHLSGWICGCVLLVGSALSTNLTAKYLGRILRAHPNLMTYGDISFAYGGKAFAIFVTSFFILDLLGASLSMIILFSDCFAIIWPHKQLLKLIIISIVFFTSLLPLSILSIFSLFGILCTIGIIGIIIACGFVLDESPGSLLQFAPTNLWPQNFPSLLFSLGIFMAPWGGHPVFPELYRDMRHPTKFSKTSNISFSVTFVLDFAIGITGYLMYGSLVDDSVIKSIMQNPNYPEWINKALCLLMGILPISKLPLVTRPIITSYEKILGLTPSMPQPIPPPPSSSPLLSSSPNPSYRPHLNRGLRQKTNSFFKLNTILRVITRLAFCSVLLVLALMLSSFGKVVSFLGSAICYTVCLALPLLFYLELNSLEISSWQRIITQACVIMALVFAISGTYATITA